MLTDTLLHKFADRYPARLATVLPADKALHVIAGLAIGTITALIVPHWYAAPVVGLMAGLGKEAVDAILARHWDSGDILATLAGSVLAVPFSFIR